MEPYLLVNKRWKDKLGPILDIGCFEWNWSEQFAGERHVIGIDPVEQTQPKWATLLKGVVAPFSGKATMSAQRHGGDGSVLFGDRNLEVEAFGLQDLLVRFVNPVIIKMNVEGSEYPLLMSVQHPITDQLIVSFHDQSWLGSSIYPQSATMAMISYLSQWYRVFCLYQPCQWYQFLRK
jgi:hypothetical protein